MPYCKLKGKHSLVVQGPHGRHVVKTDGGAITFTLYDTYQREKEGTGTDMYHLKVTETTRDSTGRKVKLIEVTPDRGSQVPEHIDEFMKSGTDNDLNFGFKKVASGRYRITFPT
jgi:hypothetical protein